MQLKEALRVGTQAADALAEAHRHGLIHRDMKPANIFLTSRGDAKILDFGLAKVVAAVASATTTVEYARPETLSEEGMAVGTIAYMSPEQLRAEPLDHRSDPFSLGIVLFEMFAGKQPFDGTSAITTADGILNRPPHELNRRVPSRVRSLILRLLEKDPNS